MVSVNVIKPVLALRGREEVQPEVSHISLTHRGRYILRLILRDDKTAINVEEATRRAILTLPVELRRSITWDQGTETSAHRSLTSKTGIPIYSYDPHSSWQQGRT